MEPITTGMTGLRMIAEGIKWIWRSQQAPWSVINLTATISPHVQSWYAVRFWCSPEKPFAVEILTAKTIRPSKLQLCRADGSVQLGRLAGTEVAVLDNLGWVISEKGASTMAFQRWLFVNLKDLKGKTQVDFELKVRFLDNRRTETIVWARTNSITV
jgi:hypothetical protein